MRLWFAALIALLAFAPPTRSQVDPDATVRVRLLGGSAGSEAVLEPVGDYATVYVDGLEVVGVAPGEAVTLERAGADARWIFPVRRVGK